MAKPRWGHVLRDVHSLFDEGVIPSVPDGALLERYATSGRESAERAFAALVDRHGPMVQRVCRTVLRDEHAAQDAFQATFLVLARKARSLWVHASIGPWLHGVAYRTSLCARNAAARRRFHERRAADQRGRDAGPAGVDDLGPILHQEVDRLPERFRAAVVLCYLEGLTHEQAAERLGCPVGTVRSRLANGRDRLRSRLTVRGLSPANDVLERTTALEESAGMVPAALAGAAVRNAMIYAAEPVAGMVPTAVAALANKGLRAMLFARLRTLSLVLLVLGGGTAGLFAFAQGRQEPARPDQPKAQAVAKAQLPPQVRALLQARVNAAHQIITMEIEKISFGNQKNPEGSLPAVFEQIAIWSRRLMKDRLRLAETPVERLGAIREYRKYMTFLEEITKGANESGSGSPIDAAKAKYHRLEADQLLVEAGGDPEKEKPEVDVTKMLDPNSYPATAPPLPR
jgi:RNA polymerase sigma factor (sigma-70 family)